MLFECAGTETSRHHVYGINYNYVVAAVSRLIRHIIYIYSYNEMRSIVPDKNQLIETIVWRENGEHATEL